MRSILATFAAICTLCLCAAPTRSMVAGRHISGSASPLPYDAEVEWIQTGDGAWADTGVKPVPSIVVQIRLLATRDIGDTIFGFNLGNDNKDWRVFNSTQQLYFDWGLGRLVGGSNTLRNNTWYEFELGNYYVKDIPTDTILLSGTSRDSDVLDDSTLTFGHGRNTTASARFAWCRISIGGVLVRDFISVRFTNENGVTEGAMYDRVSGALFRNAGTGAFIIGPDKN